jgi:hypothetical protein
LFGVVILDSPSIVPARLRAAVMAIDQGAEFCEGLELDEATAALVCLTRRSAACSTGTRPPSSSDGSAGSRNGRLRHQYDEPSSGKRA